MNTAVTEIRLGNTAPIETHMVQVTKEQTEGDNPKAPLARREWRVQQGTGKMEAVYLAPERVAIAHRMGITERGKEGPDGTVTVLRVPSTIKVTEVMASVQTLYSQHHSDTHPAWVESDNELWAAVLAEAWGVNEADQQVAKDAGEPVPDVHECRVGRPRGWKAYSEPAPIAGGAVDEWTDLGPAIEGMMEPWELVKLARLRTNAGTDFQARVMGDTASTGTGSYAAGNYVALSTDATAPAAGDTTLTSELTLSGLGRAQGTYAHTGGAVTYTITKAFTSADATPRTIQKIGIFNASSAGTLVFETALASPPTLQSGDSLTVTETVTMT